MNETTIETVNVVKEIAIASPAMDQYYSILTWVVAIVGFLLAVVLFYLIIILRDASYVSHKAKETSDTLNEYVRKPAGVIMQTFSSLEGVSEILIGQATKLFGAKKRRRKKKDEDYED